MYTHLNNPISAQPFSETFRELLGFLFREPFALTNGFQELNFEEIGLILEEPFGGAENLMESYDSCKSTYCLMLLELELQGLSSLPPSLITSPLKELSDVAIYTKNESAGSVPVESEPTRTPQSEKVHQLITELELDLENEPKTALHEIVQPLSLRQSEAEPVTTEQSSSEGETESLPHQEIDSQLINLKPSESSSTVLNPLANEYLKISNAFRSDLQGKENAPKYEAAMRAVTHFKIGALEIELFNKIKNDLENIWQSRLEKIQSLLQRDNFRFNEEQETQFQAIEEQFGNRLYNEKFPRLATLHCLKYLSLSKSVELMQPTVFEIGTFIYFWGSQDPCPFGELSLLNSQQKLEIALRLFRLDRHKAHASNFNRQFSQEQLSQVEEDTSEILTILNFKNRENAVLKAA